MMIPVDDTASNDDLDGLRVVAHPLRLRLLSLLTGDSLSAAEAARALGETQANVSYHLRRLAQAGLVELVEETRIRGGVAKRYRHDPASGESLRSGDQECHVFLMAAMSRQLQRRAQHYVAESELVFTDAEVWVPADAWAQIRELARELGTVIHDAAQPRREGLVRVGATVAMFEMDGPAPDADGS